MELTTVEKQVAKILVESINRISSFDYKELANLITPPIHHRTQLPTALGNVSYLCHELGLPLLSVKVINRATNKAGIGFYNLYCDLFPDGKNRTPDDVENEERQKIRLWDNWQPLLDYLDVNIDVPVSPLKQKQEQSQAAVSQPEIIMDNQQADFMAWLKKNTTLSDSSLQHYVGAIKSISEWFNINVSEIISEHDITEFIDKCNLDPLFTEENAIGNRMYSVALNHYKRFVISKQAINVLDDEELIDNINGAPLIVDEEIRYRNEKKRKPELVDTPNTGKRHPRDVNVSKNALSIAKYKCECDNLHLSFRRKSPPHLTYTEPHHLIPLSAYQDFEFSLDVEENICSLCSNCHNCLHYGKDNERDRILERLFEKRRNHLVSVGLGVTFEKLKKYY